MADRKRRAAAEAEAEEMERDSGDESGSVSSEESEEEIDEVVKVDFEAHIISDDDYSGIKKLLKQLFLKASVNTAELTGIIIQQNHIGSVIRQAEILDENSDDDEDDIEVFGFITLLHLTERQGTDTVEQIKELILSQCEKQPKGTFEQLKEILNDDKKPVGFLISERFINVPPQIALPLHKQLQIELAAAQRTNKPCGKCHYYLMISKTCVEVVNDPRQRGNQQKKLMFANAEDEFFYEQATLKFDYSVEEESDSCLSGRWSFDDIPMKPLRTVMLIPADRMNIIMDKLKEYLSV
uniref:Protein BCCIP homolog n=1 Tax=Callorhinchus milii TaxID=7868 RepID=A0A4W3HNE6_CALMI|eukprot:gi/632971411/ref/XP_007902159.1/ PREDICTED: BRCA2 and CDKN1A-interacting protein [Callorhinchus milii]